jgi:hypothetical protein
VRRQTAAPLLTFEAGKMETSDEIISNGIELLLLGVKLKLEFAKLTLGAHSSLKFQVVRKDM